MDTRKKVGKGAVRAALQALGEGGKEISYRLVFEALGLENDAEQAVARSRISDMTRYGEVKRTRTGCFIYDFKRRPHGGKSYETLWRFVRKAKPGWSISECSMMTSISYTQAMRYCNWLEEEGFVERTGRDSRKATTWRATIKADKTPETPYRRCGKQTLSHGNGRLPPPSRGSCSARTLTRKKRHKTSRKPAGSCWPASTRNPSRKMRMRRKYAEREYLQCAGIAR